MRIKHIITCYDEGKCKICNQDSDGRDICEVCCAINREVFFGDAFGYEDYLMLGKKDKHTEACIKMVKERFKK